MITEMVLAGVGGQGIVMAGQIVATAAMNEGKYVTCLPSYGAEMRGGNSNSTIIISDRRIGAPTSARPDAILVLAGSALTQFEPSVKTGGLVMCNDLVQTKCTRSDIKCVIVPSEEIAAKIGSSRVAITVALGALVAYMRVVAIESLVDALVGTLPSHRQDLVALNQRAIRDGAALISKN